MTRSVLCCFHKYTPYGHEYYAPILDFFVSTMKKYKKEYNKVYFLDSNWEIDPVKLDGLNFEIIRINPSTRYYDAYKEVLPQIKEDLVLFTDNDFVVYKKGVIASTFDLLTTDYDVVTIYDIIGDFKTNKMGGKNKFCPYWFATRKDLLMEYRDVEWGPDMPYCETLGHLTEKMLEDDLVPFEIEEDKSNFLFDRSDGDNGKRLGYYHIRAGSTPAYLLATKKYGNKDTYLSYIRNQPRSEYLRQMAWYQYMGGDVQEMILDQEVILASDPLTASKFWDNYYQRFIKYHGLK